MNIRYTANGVDGTLPIASAYLLYATAEDMAELVTITHWMARPHEIPPEVTVVHLRNVDGVDLGKFDVRHQMHRVYTATAQNAAG